ncbi:major capsid protein VP1 [Gokushovirinae Bog1183_53]|uniref:major capsid protein VP1 n=1 Tax=Gokushovirinae Bog1183_53 TaxID=1655646 RepID=UPI00063D5CF4|nr:major capsid protein VP1 [Gokushovirinae Bog1183_53]AKI26866.1 major capsid protein VP1 [Gokushovirinae Bog1183_53]
MRSVMKHQFSMIPRANIPRSTFNRSHGYKTTFRAGYLIPFYVDEVLPGDTFNLKVSTFARLLTPIVPIMDNMFMDIHFFVVPNRLVWNNWEKFAGQGNAEPGDENIGPTDFVIPTVKISNSVSVLPQFYGVFPAYANLTGVYTHPVSPPGVGDYFGLPLMPSGVLAVQSTHVSALPFRAYRLIWNEWFRDENLQHSVHVNLTDSQDVLSENLTATSNDGVDQLLSRGKRHDYFTSCLPFPQKGPGVEIPLGTTAPVHAINTGITAANAPFMRSDVDGTRVPLGVAGSTVSVDYTSTTPTSTTGILGLATATPGTYLGTYYDPASTLYADLSLATAATINSLRQAFQIQKLYERDARGGTRYTEVLRAHFGVVSPDARLQRPEYLGGGSVRVIINPVAQTSATNEIGGVTPQGNLAAYGIVSSHGHGFIRSFVEHSIIIGLVSVRADLSYQQNINRMWSRQTRFDFYWPVLSHLGEDAVLNKEIYFDTTANVATWNNEEAFGYQERWADYRYYPSQITGYFRSYSLIPVGDGVPYFTSLDYWHLSQAYQYPKLNAAWIQENPPIDRIIAVPGTPEAPEPHFLLDAFFDIKCVRPMPVYSVPGLIDHF